MNGLSGADWDRSVDPKPNCGWGWQKLLVVMVLLAGVCATTLPMGVSVRNKARRAKTEAMLKVIDQGLEKYRTDNGDYPRPKSSRENIMIDGITVGTGPARALYQALSGDGDDSIEGGVQASTGTTKDNARFYWEDIVNPVIDGQVRKGVPVLNAPTGLMLIDPWGNPLQYEVFDQEQSDEVVQNTRNMTYDLSSFGPDESLGSDPDYEAKWITNW